MLSEPPVLSGGGETFRAETRVDGTVVLSDVGSERLESGAASTDGVQRTAALIPACSDGAFTLDDFRESQTHQWHIKTSSIPSYLNVTNTIERIRNGIRNITQVFNDCGLADNVSATSNYQGSTTQGANHNGVSCTFPHDNINVVDFGHVPDLLAVTCNNDFNGELLNSDVRLSTTVTWTVNPGAGCSGKYDIESLMTHERGHTYGLDHVTGSDHTGLTMHPLFSFCGTSERTLALGDVRGLEQKY